MENIRFNWQTRQANLSSGQLWCYLELCWNCFNWWKRSGLACLMTTELVLAPSPRQWWYMHLKLQVAKLASQNHPKGTKQNQNNKTKAWNKQTKKKVSLNRIHSLTGLTKPTKMLPLLQGKGQQRAVLPYPDFNYFFYLFKQLHEKKKLFDKQVVASATGRLWNSTATTLQFILPFSPPSSNTPLVFPSLKNHGPFLSIEIPSCCTSSTFVSHLLAKILEC